MFNMQQIPWWYLQDSEQDLLPPEEGFLLLESGSGPGNILLEDGGRIIIFN